MNTKPNSKFMFSVILLCAFLKSHVSLAADTISEKQSLSGDQTIVSAGGMFELGFFKPGQISNYYIGIWYSKQVVSEMTVVWVANREIPVSNRFSSMLTILDGNLVLLNMSKIPVWSTDLNSTTSSSSVQAVLLDSGNLVFIAGSSNNTSEPLWQSFDHPTHTWLPGGKLGFNKITNHTQIITSWKNLEDPAPGLYSVERAPDESNSYIALWNRSRQYWTTGPWNESTHTFNMLPEMRLFNITALNIFNYSYVTNENESYITYSSYNPKIVSRYLMSASGQIQHLRWMENSKQWKLIWSQPKLCNVYASCGAFSSCKPTSLNYCKCLKGFVPNRQSDWDLQIYSGGCSRRTSVKCGNATGDGFLKVNSESLPDNRQYEGALSIESCIPACLNDCQCTGYTYDSSNGCSIWHGDVLNLHEVEANEGDGSTLYIRAAASDIKEKRVIKPSLLIAIVSTITGLIVVIFGCFLWKKTLGKKREHKKNYNETKSKFDVGGGGGKDDAELRIFGLRAIVAATNNFVEANKLGEGGFGPVYKGILAENQEVAIKRLSKKSGQGQQEFMNELKLIAKLQHTNLVRLLGCCLEDEEMILIYEYMPNRSLDKLLFGCTLCTVSNILSKMKRKTLGHLSSWFVESDASEKIELNWGRRFRIIEGIAQGVLYIHKYSRLKIIHRDLKASNILLDGALNPKISDFGMARIFGINQTEANTNRVVGTYGYMSPEYARYGHFSEKLDVFSFGVLLLEIVSGKKNAAFYRFEHSPTLAGWAWELWKDGRGMEVIDESVRETCRLNEALKCIHVGFLCVQEALADRPTMSSVIHMLQGNESTSLPPSKEPAFSTHKNSNHVRSSEMPTIFSDNSITMSLPEGR